MKYTEIAEIVGVHPDTVSRWIKAYQAQGSRGHTPFPTGSVTLRMNRRSMSLRLLLSHSRKEVSDLLLPLQARMFSKHAQASTASSMIPTKFGHTIGNISGPRPVGCVDNLILKKIGMYFVRFIHQSRLRLGYKAAKPMIRIKRWTLLRLT